MATRAEKSTKLAHSAHSASKTETETNRNRIQIRATLCQPPHLSGRTASVSGAETSFSFFYAKEQSVLLLLLLVAVVVILFSVRSSKRSCSAYARWHFDDLKSSLTHTHTHAHKRSSYAAAGVQCGAYTPYIYMDIYSTYMHANLSSRRAPTEGRMQLWAAAIYDACMYIHMLHVCMVYMHRYS